MGKLQRYQAITDCMNRIRYYNEMLSCLDSEKLKSADIEIRASGFKGSFHSELTVEECQYIVKKRLADQKRILKSL